MEESPVAISLVAARRLAVTKQHLAGPYPTRVGKDELLALVRELAFVQWDPVSIVAPSHLLSLWSRLGAFRPADLESLLWDDRRLFEHWMPIASVVPTEEYPLFASYMERYPHSLSPSWGTQREKARKFLAGHVALRRAILTQLGSGPKAVGDLVGHRGSSRRRDDWAPSSDVAEMLYHLCMQGKVMVVGRRGAKNLWGLSEDFLPKWVDREALGVDEAERRSAEMAVRTLGVASARDIRYHFPRGRYLNLERAVQELRADSVLRPVLVDGLATRPERYVHERDLPLLEQVVGRDWTPRLSLLPPFDAMVSSPAWTQALFGFDYVREQFLPAAKRRFGTYVLPVLWEDRFVGRIDPRFDRASGRLVINAIHAEPGTPRSVEVGRRLRAAIEGLAEFVGARGVTYPGRVPNSWRSAFG